MRQNRIRGEWAGSSHLKERREELLKAHKEFERMLADGWQVANVRKKRPRIQREKSPREVEVAIFGGKVRMTFAEYQQRGQGLKVIMEIF